MQDVALRYFKTNLLDDKEEYEFNVSYPCQTEAVLSTNYNTDAFGDLIDIAKGYKLDQGVDELLSKYFISWQIGSFASFYMTNFGKLSERRISQPYLQGFLAEPVVV